MPSIVGTTVLVLIGYVIYTTYTHRARIYRLRKAGYPMPPWNWVFGHLLLLKKYTDRHPADTFITTPIRDMARDFPESDMFYLDLWPFTTPVLALGDADTSNQATTKNPFPKADSFNIVFEPIMGGPNLLSMNDQEWKEWRALMNPGFGSGYIQDLLPAIMDNVEVFCAKIRERAGTLFCIEELVTRMTMDIIVKVTLDDDMNYQNGPNPLADSLRAMISWTSFGNFFIRHNPTRPLIMKYYGGIMNRYIQGAMAKRWAEYKAEKAQGASKRSKSAISLALEGYMKKLDNKGIEGAELDAHFAAYAQYQIRLFLFAGHDTTTGSLVYSLHMLAKYPEVLHKVQEEHTSVFGPDPAEAGNCLRENPALVNQLPYTLAVIKETMRMYAPSGAVRDGVPGRFIVDRHGKQFPTEGIHISIMHSAVHDNPRIWPRVREFVPERWLVEPGHELHPPHGAWRAFEVGPRNCIGQTLALMELRLTLIMVARTFSIKPAYEEWDKIKPKGMLERMGLAKEGMNTVDGDRAYPIERGGGHPKDQYPCRVTVL